MKNLLYILVGYATLITVMGCDKGESIESNEEDNNNNQFEFATGWNGNDNVEEVPTSLNTSVFGDNNLPPSVNLVPKFPPIGNQNHYGTCVAWAIAYNAKTAANAIENGLSTSELSSPSNQFSPKDLFVAIPNNLKGFGCEGTNFEPALDVLLDRGVATMQTVPYSALGDCSTTNLQPNWNNEANQNKIKYWRKISPTIKSIKENLANNIPIVFGARLPDNFYSWDTDNVLTSGNTNNGGGGHAMVLAGYDDNKGPNGAFRVINSWGTTWADGGYIWIDYVYFINEFIVGFGGQPPLFIFDNEEGNTTPPDDSNPPNTGVDLAPWVFSDYSTYTISGNPLERFVDFNIYNIGNQTASPNSDWSFYYLYYNAYNANDYGFLFWENFNTSIAPNTYFCPAFNNCIFNYSIPAGGNFTQTVFGIPSTARTYNMPQISGYYYLVMVVDATDRFQEQDELNNLFYTTVEPKFFDFGYSRQSNTDSSSNNFEFFNEITLNDAHLKKSKFSTVITEEFKNAYTQKEILEFVKQEFMNGNIDRKKIQFEQELNKSPYSN